MPWGRIRILADNEDADIFEWLTESAENVVACGQVRPARGDLGAQEISGVGYPPGYRGQGVRPARIHDFF